ncbi:MAG: hypothetical protein HQL08_00600 [Nitrospirae bacterium]|nr:hypothetical protein [Nitrospirota bacterium]
MVLETVIDGASITIPIAEPFKPDLKGIIAQIDQLAASKGTDIVSLDINGLILQMIRGIAGCESGCPADAKSLISRGYSGFNLNYIEGGILTARAATGDGRPIHLKMFPDF